jgi:RNA recognition motif-containing protein
MNTSIYFDTLPATVTGKELMELFCAHGNVVDIHIVIERTGDQPCSHGSVTMITPEGAQAAIKSINGKPFGAGTLVLSETPPGEEEVDSKNDRMIPRRMMSHLY